MYEPERTGVEPPDHACERCGYTKPRLMFDQSSRLILCERCVEAVRERQAWPQLHEAGAV